MRGIKIPQRYFALKMQGAYARGGGGGAYLRDTTVYLYCSSFHTRITFSVYNAVELHSLFHDAWELALGIYHYVIVKIPSTFFWSMVVLCLITHSAASSSVSYILSFTAGNGLSLLDSLLGLCSVNA